MKFNFGNIFLKTLVITSLVFCFYTTVNAQATEYTLLAPLPCTTTGDTNCNTLGTTANFKSYLPGAVKLAIGFAAVLAFVMITYGGILYATTDAISGKETGKEYITNAIYGLILVIGAWAILNTINPRMLEFDLDLPVVKLATVDNSVILSGLEGVAKPGYTLTSAQLVNNDALRTALSQNHVTVNANPCAGGETKGCTNVVGLPQNAITGVETLAAACNCNGQVVITGGTEGGHTTHGVNLPVMDLGKTKALDDYVKKNGTYTGTTKWGNTYDVKVGDKVVKFLDETAGAPGSSGVHWHVVFP